MNPSSDKAINKNRTVPKLLTKIDILNMIARVLLIDNLPIKDRRYFTKTYIDMAGYARVHRRNRKKEEVPEEAAPEPSLDEVILRIEKESKNGQ
jgi:hypothetical protein